MSAPASRHLVTPEEYLAAERAAQLKHQYVDGEVFAMAGTSREHSAITLRFASELLRTLRGRPCDVHSTDMRIRVNPKRLYTYPDVSVACGAQFADDQRDTLLNPQVIVEVLSTSTESFDRGRKFELYRSLPSLVHYVLASQTEPLVECFTRQPDGSWVLRTYRSSDRLPLPAIECEIAVDDVYVGVFPAGEAGVE